MIQDRESLVSIDSNSMDPWLKEAALFDLSEALLVL